MFIFWTNGVPTVKLGFSSYFKVGKTGGGDVRYLPLTCSRLMEQESFSEATDAERRAMLAGWVYPESANPTNAVQWNSALAADHSTASGLIARPNYKPIEIPFPLIVRSGHQRVIPLVDSEAPGNESIRVELRVFMEPFNGPLIKSAPDEIDPTNYLSGRGLAGTMEEALDRLKNLPLDP